MKYCETVSTPSSPGAMHSTWRMGVRISMPLVSVPTFHGGKMGAIHERVLKSSPFISNVRLLLLLINVNYDHISKYKFKTINIPK